MPFEALTAAAADEAGGVPDLSAALARIRQVARVLGNFAALRDPNRARAEYVEQVRGAPGHMCGVYGALHLMGFRP